MERARLFYGNHPLWKFSLEIKVLHLWALMSSFLIVMRSFLLASIRATLARVARIVSADTLTQNNVGSLNFIEIANWICG